MNCSMPSISLTDEKKMSTECKAECGKQRKKI